MSTVNIKPKKSKIMQKRNFLFLAVSSALAVVSLSQARAAANNFAEVPFHLQGKTTTTKAYSVKPNVTLYIDDSGSMSAAVAQRCPVVHIYTCQRLNPFNKRCAVWGPVSVHNKEVVIKQGAPLIVTEDDPSQPVEKHIRTFYLYCRVDYTRMDAVKRALNSVVDKYRDKFYFALQPMDDWLKFEKDPDKPGGFPLRRISFNKFYDASKPEEYQQLKDYINGNQDKNILPLRPTGGTPTHQRLNAVVRNTVFNKLRYRCQKSYLILFSDGEAGDFWALDDRTRFRDWYGGQAGYFDGYFDENKEPREVISVPLTKKLQYYTDILRTKSFGNYIYKKSFVDEFGGTARYATEDDGLTYYYENGRLPKRADLQRTVDEAGQPWDSPIPDSESGERFTQTVRTYTIGSGLGGIPYAIEYLRNGASPRPERDPTKQDPERYFFKADDADEILNAFENIFKEMGGETTEGTIITTAKTPKI
ncbi:MAG: hypothetical protein J6585_08170, partial [Snodgrassella sp.]|nr:hypothetical protein [Snodgrassella sp.]